MSDSTIDYLKAYTAMMLHGFDYWAVPGLRQLRTQVEQTPVNAEQHPRVAQLDGYSIDTVIDFSDDEVPDDLLQDDPSRPLSQWWWHLGQLQAGTYPAHLLPSHLRAIYQPDSRLAA